MRTLLSLAIAAAIAGCGLIEKEVPGPPRKESIVGLTESGKLVRFNAGQPWYVTVIGAVNGLQPGERLVGIDYRVSRGVLFGLGSTGRIYTINTNSAEATALAGPLAAALHGREVGFDFNPAVDRIRIVTDAGQNFRAHPDTGAAVDGDPKADGFQPDATLAYTVTDVHAKERARIVGAAYTYNKANEKITTNFAIDAATGSLVTQGSREGATPAVSPNTGLLFTTGRLGVGSFARAGFDIADVSNAAYLALDLDAWARTRLYSVDLATGRADFIGTVRGERLRSIAIEP